MLRKSDVREQSMFFSKHMTIIVRKLGTNDKKYRPADFDINDINFS